MFRYHYVLSSSLCKLPLLCTMVLDNTSDKITMSAFKTRLEFGSKDVQILILCPWRVHCTESSGEAESVVWPRCEMWPVADRRLQDGLVLPYPGRDSPRLQIPVLTRPMLSPPLPELLPYHRHRHTSLSRVSAAAVVSKTSYFQVWGGKGSGKRYVTEFRVPKN